MTIALTTTGDREWWLRTLEEAPADLELPAPADGGDGGDGGDGAAALPQDVDALGVLLAGLLARYSSGGRVVVTLGTGGEWLPVFLDLSDDPDAATARKRWATARASATEHRLPLAELAADVPAVTRVALAADGSAWPLGEPPAVLVTRGGSPTVRVSSGSALAPTLLGHLTALAAGWHDTVPLSAVTMLSSTETAALLQQQGSELAIPDGTVWSLIRGRAATHPATEALADHDRSLTYADLVTEIESLAGELRTRGAGPGHLVGVSVRRSADMVVALLAVMCSGAAYVPIDPDYPAERVAMMIEDAALTLVVTRGSDPTPVALAGVTRVDVDAPRRADDTPGDAQPVGELAYVIFTSGSTGRPKGVMIGHRALLNFVLAIAERPGMTSRDRLLAVTTLSFDIAALELLVPLTVGGCVVVADSATVVDPAAIAERLLSDAITVMQATPATWRMLLDWGWTGGAQLRVLCGGEALPAALAAGLAVRCAELWNMYGPTETTIWSLATRLGPRDPVTIGAPIANTFVYVTGRRGELVPAGVAGELSIGGLGLADGYLGRTELTSEKFRPDPFRPGTPDARMYRTGDLVRRRPDGGLDFIGRMDSQVKVRGFRIECGEVETALERLDPVAQAVAVVRPDERTGANRLLAYVLPEPGAGPADGVALRRELAPLLPDYMLPSIVTVLERFPLTLNGKIDRAALPEPAAGAGRAEFAAPGTELERTLVEVWERVLGISPIGVDDDVFELGVDSLTTARLFAAVGRQVDLRLPIAAAFEGSTVARLAGVIERMRSERSGRGRAASLVAIRATGSGVPLFLVHGGAGTVLLYQPLALGLGDERPVFAFQAAGLLGDRHPHATVPQMARAYVAEMRAVQPLGPYRLGGYCFGALVAFEMARQLEAAGERVELVISFNGPSPSYIRTYRPQFDRNGAVVPRSTRSVRGTGELHAQVALVRRDPRSAPRLARHLAGLAKVRLGRHRRRLRIDAQLVAAVALRRPVPVRLRESIGFQRISELAQARYRPPVWDGPILVVGAAGLYRRPDLGWGDHTRGEVTTITVDGEQITPRQTMTQRFVTPVAEAVRTRLDELDRQRP